MAAGDPVYHGNALTELVLQSESDLVTNAQNQDSYTANWVIQRDSAVAKAPRIGDESTKYPGLYAVSRRIHETPPDIAEITVEYSGAVDTVFGNPPPAQYSLNGSALDRPIQQHPEFDDESKFPTSFKSFRDAKDSTGAAIKVFDGFKDDSPMRGIEAYIVGSARWTEVRYSLSAPQSNEIYHIGRRSIPKQLGGAEAGFWLKTGVAFEQQGRFWVIRTEWTYSGDQPWNSNIYGE